MKLNQLLILLVMCVATASAYTDWYSPTATQEFCFDVYTNDSVILNVTFNASNFTFGYNTQFVKNDSITSLKYYFNLSSFSNKTYILYTPTTTHKSYCFYNDVSSTNHIDILKSVTPYSPYLGFNNCSELQANVQPPNAFRNYSLVCDGNKSNVSVYTRGMIYSTTYTPTYPVAHIVKYRSVVSSPKLPSDVYYTSSSYQLAYGVVFPDNGTSEGLAILQIPQDQFAASTFTAYNLSSPNFELLYPPTLGNVCTAGADTCAHNAILGIIGDAAGDTIQIEYGVVPATFSNLSFTEVTNVTYDSINTNISILTPTWGQVYSGTSQPVLRIQYLGGFDNCSVMLNGAYIVNYSSADVGNMSITSEQITNSITGENRLNISCMLNGNETHRYWYYVRTGTSADAVFECAFNTSISELACPSSTVLALSVCTECYNMEYPYKFSAVVCPYLANNVDYSCLSSLANVTKANNQGENYTIFYAPITWQYPGQNLTAADNVQHIGAMFYFGSSPVNTGIELYKPDRFIYIPAQNRSRDCSVYFNTASPTTLQWCSYFGGFVLNDRPVFIADRTNNWFIGTGFGVVHYNESYANMTNPVGVLTVEPYLTGEDIFPNGIYTRANCYIQNNTYYIADIENTKDKYFTVTALYNTSLSYDYNVTSKTLYENISVIDLEYIIISDENGQICYYDGTTTLFLPFSIPSIELEGFDILTKVLFIFIVIISCFVPFGLIAAVILNDVYQIVDITNMSRIFAFVAIAGLTINSFSFDRGIKHLFIVLAIGVAYVSAMTEVETAVGVDLSEVRNLLTSAGNLTSCEGTTNCLWQFVSNTPAFIIQLFIFILTLPVTIVDIIMNLLNAVTPILATAIRPFADILKYAAVIYFYLKAYEVLSKQFRSI